MPLALHHYFFFTDPATTEIYTSSHTLSLHDALPIYRPLLRRLRAASRPHHPVVLRPQPWLRGLYLSCHAVGSRGPGHPRLAALGPAAPWRPASGGKMSTATATAGRTPAQSRRYARIVFRNWSGARDLNPGPHGPEPCRRRVLA